MAAGAQHAKTGRNAPCPCGSGKKYKHCCLARPSDRMSWFQKLLAALIALIVGGGLLLAVAQLLTGAVAATG